MKDDASSRYSLALIHHLSLVFYFCITQALVLLSAIVDLDAEALLSQWILIEE